LDLDFVFAEETLLVLCLTYIYAESDKSRIVRLVADAEQILIDNSQNRIGSGLKNIRVRTPVLGVDGIGGPESLFQTPTPLLFRNVSAKLSHFT